jgi:CBS domain-containing protein
MLPALPLDGGRVLRSLLAMKMSHLQATEISAAVSKFLAVALGIFGLLGGGIFLIFIAFFIYIAVNSETQHSLIVQMLRGMRVRDLMSRDVQSVRPDMTVAELTQRMLRERRLGFPVIDDRGSLVGVVTLRDLHNSAPDARVSDVMTAEPRTIPEDAPAVEAFRQMSQNNFGRLIAIDRDGQISGIITTTDVMKTIQVQTVGLQWDGQRSAAADRWAQELTPRHV